MFESELMSIVFLLITMVAVPLVAFMSRNLSDGEDA